MLEDVDEVQETMRIEVEPLSTINCFALMLKHKLDKCMMKCDDCFRCFTETLTN